MNFYFIFIFILYLINICFCRPINQFDILNNSSSINNIYEESSFNITNSTQYTFDIRELIGIRSDDWRDDKPKNDIIWSHESRYHPEFGKIVARVGGDNDRVGRSSQYMSFVILGTVIGFVLYSYLSHVIFVRKLRREIERAQLRSFIHSSALIMAHSVQRNNSIEGNGERRKSILNAFRAFRL